MRPYERPQQVGSILLPPTAYRDPTASLYEVVCSSTADEAGVVLAADDIVKLPRLEAVTDLGCDDLEGRPLLAARISDIASVNRWRTEDVDG